MCIRDRFYVHNKIHEVEHENVGVEGAHKSELAADAQNRSGGIKETPHAAGARAVDATLDQDVYKRQVYPSQ